MDMQTPPSRPKLQLPSWSLRRFLWTPFYKIQIENGPKIRVFRWYFFWPFASVFSKEFIALMQEHPVCQAEVQKLRRLYIFSHLMSSAGLLVLTIPINGFIIPGPTVLDAYPYIFPFTALIGLLMLGVTPLTYRDTYKTIKLVVEKYNE